MGGMLQGHYVVCRAYVLLREGGLQKPALHRCRMLVYLE